MRPLVVLLLVLGSLAALLIALTTLTRSDREGDEGRGLTPVEAPSTNPGRPEDMIAPALRQEEEKKAARASTEETRKALQPDADPSGRKVAFGAIEGIVVDRQGVPIAEAQVSLLNSKPSVLGEEIHALRGTDPPRPVSKAVTKAEGTFRFDQLDPRKDWSLVVSRERYVSYTTEVAITVPEGGVWKETVFMDQGQTASPCRSGRRAIDGARRR